MADSIPEDSHMAPATVQTRSGQRLRQIVAVLNVISVAGGADLGAALSETSQYDLVSSQETGDPAALSRLWLILCLNMHCRHAPNDTNSALLR